MPLKAHQTPPPPPNFAPFLTQNPGFAPDLSDILRKKIFLVPKYVEMKIIEALFIIQSMTSIYPMTAVDIIDMYNNTAIIHSQFLGRPWAMTSIFSE